MANKNNWQIRQLQAIASFEGGGTPSRARSEFFKEGTIPWVKTLDLNNSCILQTEESITELALKKSSCKILPKNAVLIAMYGGFNQIGRTGLLSIEAAINQAITAVILDQQKLLPQYLLYYLNFNVQKWKKFAISSRKDPNITKEDIKKLYISFPSTTLEQGRIVEVLETWDKAIGLTKRRIEQKELQKKYLMQQLLTGRTRLKGFTYEWKESRLNKIKEVVIEKGKPLTKQQLKPGTIPVIAGGQNIPYYHNCWTHDFPCITISASGAYAGFVWIHHEKIWASDCNVLYCTEYDLNFLYFCLKYQQGRLFYLQTGGAQGHVYAGEIGSLLLPNIPLKEQQAIANVLSSCDKGIDLLKQKLAKLEEQKKGLMQVLLTGKVRLK